MTLRFTSSSSATRIRRLARASGRDRGCAAVRRLSPEGAGALAIASGSMRVKTVPLSGVLATLISPPSRSTRRWQMARPRPLPPKRRVVEDSAWLKGRNSWPRCSGAMPMPLSATLISTRSGSPAASRAHTATRPGHSLRPPENLMALPIRLKRIWRRRMASELTQCGMSVAISCSRITPRALASGLRVLHRLSISSTSCSGALSISSLPASILEKSRMSSITPSRLLDDSRMVLIRSP
ncbi:hypothetical protein D3C84_585830 [compost metagenome]